MRNTLKLSLLTILAIPFLIMNVSAKEIVGENNTYNRGTFEYKTYTFSENVADFQELQINGTAVDEDAVTTDASSISIDWNYLENVDILGTGVHNLSFVFEGETINTTLTIAANTDHDQALNKIFMNVPHEYALNAVELDALNYNAETGTTPAMDELIQKIHDSLIAQGYTLTNYGYTVYIEWDYYTNYDPGDYYLEIYYDGDWIRDEAFHVSYSNSYLRNETDAASVEAMWSISNYDFIRFVPLLDALEAYRNGTTGSLVLTIDERLALLAEGTNVQFVLFDAYISELNYTSNILIYEYFMVVNGIIYDEIDISGGYVSIIYPPEGEEIDEVLFAQDYLKTQFLLYELMTETDDVIYDADWDEAFVSTASGMDFYGYVAILGDYQFVSGANSTIATDETLSVEVDEDSYEFLYVTVDDAEVVEKYFTVSGDTTVTFSTEFTNALSEGVHSLVVYFYEGKAETTFTVVKPVVDTTSTSTARVVYASYTNTVLETETKKEELKEVSEDKKDKSKDDKKSDETEEASKGGGKGFIIGIIIAVLIAGIGFYLYKEGQE